MKRRYDQSFPMPERNLPLIVFGCEFHSKDGAHEIGVCKACKLEGRNGETLICRLAEVWALGKGHFKYAHQGDGDF